MNSDSLTIIADTLNNQFNWKIIISFIGACAWLPWIIKAFTKYIIKPDIRIKNFRRILSILNSINGPIISIPLSIIAYKKNSSIKNMVVKIENIESKEEKIFTFFASSDVSIKRMVAKDGFAEQFEISPSGIFTLEPNKPAMREFSFSNNKDIDEAENKYSEILKKASNAKEKDENFISDAAWLKTLDEIIDIKKLFKKMATWKAGSYLITIEISLYERKKPYIFQFNGNFDQLKADMLLNDCQTYNTWVESDNFVPHKESPLFNNVNMNIDPL